MTNEEFLKQMDRLRNTFGKAAYSDERALVLSPIVQKTSVEHFAKFVNEWIATGGKAPMAEQFRDCVNKWSYLQSQNGTNSDCVYCRGSGWTQLRMRPELVEHNVSHHPHECSCLCDCESGKRMQRFYMESKDYQDVAKVTYRAQSYQSWYQRIRYQLPEHEQFAQMSYDDFKKRHDPTGLFQLGEYTFTHDDKSHIDHMNSLP